VTDTAPAQPETPPPGAKPESAAVSFTDPGCRTDLRLGALIVLGAVFLWLWWGPTASSRLYLVGALLLLWSVPLQALQARRAGRPGYPWKLGLAMAIGGAVMWPDLRFREVVGAPVQVQEVAPLLLMAGAWILAWWPLARRPASSAPSAPGPDRSAPSRPEEGLNA
jgi:hypothetical protein